MFSIRPMTIEDYDAVIALWSESDGIGLSKSDSREAIERYLRRNAGLSLVAEEDGQMLGAVLCGHDGRRGFLHHVAVRPECRGQGVGSALVDRCLEGLKAEGIDRCHLVVMTRNESGRAFWKKAGWFERPELVLMSTDL